VFYLGVDDAIWRGNVAGSRRDTLAWFWVLGLQLITGRLHRLYARADADADCRAVSDDLCLMICALCFMPRVCFMQMLC